MHVTIRPGCGRHDVVERLPKAVPRAPGEVHEGLDVQLVHPAHDLIQPFGPRPLQGVARRRLPPQHRRDVGVHVDEGVAGPLDRVLLDHEHAPGLEVHERELRGVFRRLGSRRRRARSTPRAAPRRRARVPARP